MTDRTYRIVVRLARGLFAALGLRIRVRGADNLPKSGGAVLASNHVSFLDFLFVGLVGVRRGRFVRFLTKEAVFAVPFVGRLMHAMGHIPVDRGHGEVALRRAVTDARRGEVVGVFPEATISRSWTLRAFKPGAAAVATACQVPLVPVVVWGGQRVLTVGGRASLRRGRAVTILVGSPLHPRRSDDPRAVTASLREATGRLLEQAMALHPDRPQHDGDRWWLPESHGGTAPTPAVAALLDEAALGERDRAALRPRPVGDPLPGSDSGAGNAPAFRSDQ
ncbi:hypothetical protein BA895_00925 [Humibacillus sp. DSM 29435]|uniref:lysophospholipid acyltransferase family protein n=1 Tax=Humibacillus sp. DSM 29435 TaxID=1869167 RepID=UPI000872A0AD|nr:lysophospholipid acyltransferase family protein [Humibacillus sp. DSM 29435]OFE18784.1 hypothetical protein BA895_00925 [Humibacillus sp. DSM 29435]